MGKNRASGRRVGGRRQDARPDEVKEKEQSRRNAVQENKKVVALSKRRGRGRLNNKMPLLQWVDETWVHNVWERMRGEMRGSDLLTRCGAQEEQKKIISEGEEVKWKGKKKKKSRSFI